MSSEPCGVVGSGTGAGYRPQVGSGQVGSTGLSILRAGGSGRCRSPGTGLSPVGVRGWGPTGGSAQPPAGSGSLLLPGEGAEMEPGSAQGRVAADVPGRWQGNRVTARVVRHGRRWAPHAPQLEDQLYARPSSGFLRKRQAELKLKSLRISTPGNHTRAGKKHHHHIPKTGFKAGKMQDTSPTPGLLPRGA